MTVNTMTKLTDIKMRITVLDNSTMNEEDILETEAHQTTITETEEVQITEAHRKIETVQPQATLEIHTQEITTPGITPETIILQIEVAQGTEILQLEVAQATDTLQTTILELTRETNTLPTITLEMAQVINILETPIQGALIQNVNLICCSKKLC